MARDQVPIRFCLCADDYAMTPAVTRGILEALAAEALTATSVMTTSPWWPESAAALKTYTGQADIGLHLNLTMDAPLGRMPTLAPDNKLPDIGTFLRGRKSLPLAEIDAEIGRQFDAFDAHFGGPPAHVDGHQHVHALPAIRDLVLRHLDRRGLRGTVWLRDSADRLDRIVWRGTTVIKALVVALIARDTAKVVARKGYKTNKGFAGYSDFGTDETYASLFARYIVRPGPAHLVMCHPGYVDDALRSLDPVTISREQELAFLLSPAFLSLLERRNASLCKLSTLLAIG